MARKRAPNPPLISADYRVIEGEARLQPFFGPWQNVFRLLGLVVLALLRGALRLALHVALGLALFFTPGFAAIAGIVAVGIVTERVPGAPDWLPIPLGLVLGLYVARKVRRFREAYYGRRARPTVAG